MTAVHTQNKPSGFYTERLSVKIYSKALILTKCQRDPSESITLLSLLQEPLQDSLPEVLQGTLEPVPQARSSL